MIDLLNLPNRDSLKLLLEGGVMTFFRQIFGKSLEASKRVLDLAS